MSWGSGGVPTPCVSWGWRGLKKNAEPPRIISGTARKKNLQTKSNSPTVAAKTEFAEAEGL